MDQEYPTLLTVKEVAHRFRIDQTTIRRWAKAGLLGATALPNKGRWTPWRFPKEAIDELLTLPSERQHEKS